jgi:hypothetical protein
MSNTCSYQLDSQVHYEAQLTEGSTVVAWASTTAQVIDCSQAVSDKFSNMKTHQCG